MRVTNNMLINTMLRNYERINRDLVQTNQQMVSGKKVSFHRDNPVILVESMGINTDLDQLEAHKKNIVNGKDWLESTETAIAEIGTVLARIKDLVQSGANGTMTNEDREKSAVEIEQLKSHLLQVSETNYGGEYIFSGHKVDTKPYDPTTYTYKGDEGKSTGKSG